MEQFKFTFNTSDKTFKSYNTYFSSVNSSENTDYIPLYALSALKEVNNEPFEKSFIFKVRATFSEQNKILMQSRNRLGLVYKKAVNAFLGKSNRVRYISPIHPLYISEFKYKKNDLEVENFTINLGYFERCSDSKIFMLLCIKNELALQKVEDISWVDLLNKDLRKITLFMDKEFFTEPYKKLHTNIVKNLGDLYMHHFDVVYTNDIRNILEKKDLNSIIPNLLSIIKKQKWLEKDITNSLNFKNDR